MAFFQNAVVVLDSWHSLIFQICTWFSLPEFMHWEIKKKCVPFREERIGPSLLFLCVFFPPRAKRLLCTAFGNKLKYPLSWDIHDRCLSFIKTGGLLKRVGFLVSLKQQSLINKQSWKPCNYTSEEGWEPGIDPVDVRLKLYSRRIFLMLALWYNQPWQSWFSFLTHSYRRAGRQGGQAGLLFITSRWLTVRLMGKGRKELNLSLQ